MSLFYKRQLCVISAAVDSSSIIEHFTYMLYKCMCRVVLAVCFNILYKTNSWHVFPNTKMWNKNKNKSKYNNNMYHQKPTKYKYTLLS